MLNLFYFLIKQIKCYTYSWIPFLFSMSLFYFVSGKHSPELVCIILCFYSFSILVWNLLSDIVSCFTYQCKWYIIFIYIPCLFIYHLFIYLFGFHWWRWNLEPMYVRQDSTIGLPLSVTTWFNCLNSVWISKDHFSKDVRETHWCSLLCYPLFLLFPVKEHLGRLHFGYYKDVTINIINMLEIYIAISRVDIVAWI